MRRYEACASARPIRRVPPELPDPLVVGARRTAGAGFASAGAAETSLDVAP
jgi:hypothetical protein